MKCQILFSEKKKQKYFNMSSAENFTHSAKSQGDCIHQGISYRATWMKKLPCRVSLHRLGLEKRKKLLPQIFASTFW